MGLSGEKPSNRQMVSQRGQKRRKKGKTVIAADNLQLKVRLEGIDAPELKQPFSQQSKEALSTIVFGKTVNLLVTGTDRYKRTLAVVIVAGLNVNREMEKQGMAWQFEQYSKDADLKAAQIEAKGQRRGLWVVPLPCHRGNGELRQKRSEPLAS